MAKAVKTGDVAVGRIGGKGVKHAVVATVGAGESYEGEFTDWYTMCGEFGSIVSEHLCEGPVTCRRCKATLKKLNALMGE
jgi:hypothetical protein